MTRVLRAIFCILILPAAVAAVQDQAPPASQTPARQQSQVDLIIGSRIGARPTFAVPDCLLPRDADESLAVAAHTIAAVLWDDLEFEREFRMMARDTYDSVPVARTIEAVPFDRWGGTGRGRRGELRGRVRR